MTPARVALLWVANILITPSLVEHFHPTALSFSFAVLGVSAFVGLAFLFFYLLMEGDQ